MQGFRAATAFVEISTDLDGDQITMAARRAAEGVDRELTLGILRTSNTVSDTLGRSGDDGADRMVKAVEGRLRESRSRFLASGVKISEDVYKGQDEGFKRGGLRGFLSFFSNMAKGGAEGGATLAKSLGEGFEGPAGVYLKGALGAAVAVAGPFAGALLGSALVAGFSTGVIGAGVALALKDPEIKNAAAETGERMGDLLAEAADPFKGAVLDALAEGEAALTRWEPLLKRAFMEAAPLTDHLVDGITRLGDNALPGMVDSLRGAEPVFDAIEEGLAGTGEELGSMFAGLRDDGPALASAMRIAFGIINQVVGQAGFAINVLTEAWEFLVERFFDAGRFIGNLGGALQSLPGPLGATGGKMVELGQEIGKGEAKWRQWEAAGKGAAGQVTPGMEAVAGRGRLMNQTMAASIREAQGLNKAFLLLNGGALSAREAESAYQEAIDTLTDSIKTNGRTLDLHTAKGRANDAAVRGLITSTNQKAQATYDEVNATKGSAAAQAAAAKVYAQGREQLIKNLTTILGNKEAAVALANKIMAIPKTWGTDVTLDDKASGKAVWIKKVIGEIKGKTVTVAVKYEKHGSLQGEHIIGQGTQLKAEGGEILGGSGVRDDVPVLAMGGEWMIRKHAVRALERAFGPGIMHKLNNADRPERWNNSHGSSLTRPGRISPGVSPVDTIGGVDRSGVNQGPAQPRTSYHFGPGSITLDPTKIQSVSDLVRMVEGLTGTARAYSAGSV